MSQALTQAFGHNFLGNSPAWYKRTILACLVLNPLLLFALGPFVTGWCLIAGVHFCLAMALKCYPLQPGGLLTLEAVILGLTDRTRCYAETRNNFPVILLLMFMVAGIYFMKDLLLFLFSRLLLGVRSKSHAGADVLLPVGVPVGVSRCPDRDGRDHQCGGRVLLGVPPRRLGPTIRGRTARSVTTRICPSCITLTWNNSAPFCAAC